MNIYSMNIYSDNIYSLGISIKLSVFLFFIIIAVCTSNAYSISVFGINSGAVDLNAKYPNVILKSNNIKIPAFKLKNGYELDKTFHSDKKIDILIKRNNSIFKIEQIKPFKNEKRLYINSFVINQFMIKFKFPYNFYDFSDKFPNFQVTVSDKEDNIIFKDFSYNFESFSKLYIYNKIVNGERLFLTVDFIINKNKKVKIYSQDFTADFKNEPVIMLTKGIVPYSEFEIYDRSGKSFKTKYPMFFVELKNDYFTLQKSLKPSSNHRIIRFSTPPFLNSKKIKLSLFKKNKASSRPQLLISKYILPAKKLGFYKTSKFGENTIFKRIKISNFDSFKKNFVYAKKFFLEITFKNRTRIIPFSDLCNEIILNDCEYNTKLKINIIRKINDKNEVLFTIRHFNKNSIVIPVIPELNPTVIKFPNITASDMNYSVLFYNSFDTLIKVAKIQEFYKNKSISLVGSNFISGEKIKVLIKSGNKIIEKTVISGQKSEIYLPIRKDIILFVSAKNVTDKIYLKNNKNITLKSGENFINGNSIKNLKLLSVSDKNEIISVPINSDKLFVNFNKSYNIKYKFKVKKNNFLDVNFLFPKSLINKKYLLKVYLHGNSNRFLLQNNMFTNTLFTEISLFNNREFLNKFKISVKSDEDFIDFMLFYDKLPVFHLTKSIKELEE